MKINLLDLFSGIGGFAKGLEQAGFEIENHYFSEIDKHAIANYRYNFRNAEYVGSVVDVRGKDLPRINAITFGSPCQDFSLAGKRKGMEGERSSLIGQAIRLIRELRPNFFIWENVKGTFSSNDGQDFWAIIKAFADIGGYRLEWQLLNTAWFLPQNRERIYLVGRLASECGSEVFPLRENEKISKKSFRQDASEGERLQVQPDRRASALTRRMHKGGVDDNYIKVKSATKRGYEEAGGGDSINLSVPNSKTRRGRVGKQVAQTLDTACNQAVVIGGVAMERTEEGKKLRKKYEAGQVEHGFNERRKKTIRKDGLTNCLDTNVKSQLIGETENFNIRRLTEVECERLQGFPDGHSEFGIYDGEVKEIAPTNRYKMLGNAVTVNVVQAVGEAILRSI